MLISNVIVNFNQLQLFNAHYCICVMFLLCKLQHLYNDCVTQLFFKALQTDKILYILNR